MTVFAYDAALCYMNLINKSLELGVDYRNGKELFNLARNLSFPGKVGLVT